MHLFLRERERERIRVSILFFTRISFFFFQIGSDILSQPSRSGMFKVEFSLRDGLGSDDVTSKVLLNSFCSTQFQVIGMQLEKISCDGRISEIDMYTIGWLRSERKKGRKIETHTLSIREEPMSPIVKSGERESSETATRGRQVSPTSELGGVCE